MSSLQIIQNQLQSELNYSMDVITRPFVFHLVDSKINGFLLYIQGIVNEKEIEESIIRCLQKKTTLTADDTLLTSICMEVIETKKYQIRSLHSLERVINDVLAGNTLIIFENYHEIISATTTKMKERAFSPPESQRVLRGPHIGFNEHLNSNIALIRGIIKNKNLTFEKHTIGTQTNTDICLVYLQDKVDPTILKELKHRLNNIQLSEVIESNYIEEFIHYDFFTPFPLILNSDRPDVISAEVLGSKIAILVDGTGYALLMPSPLITFLHSPDDYYFKWNLFFNRFLRFFSLIVGIYIPGLYIAFVNFEPGFIPYDLVISLASQSENKPLPLVFEVLIFTILLTVIVESALRLDKNLVLTVSLIGAIVIGQAAIEAGIVQPATLVVVSISYILSFAAPIQTMDSAMRIIRYALILMSAAFGVFGITLATIALIVHLAHLRSFGVPYLSPFAPFDPKDQKDTIIRFSLPKILKAKNKMHHEEPFFKKKK
ncbi:MULTISPECIES: spore germination protein [Bacillus]|uniref:spore germination protein n=1 Tax=Bacillus TaxID=1386 RepID=UPI000317699C|nr:MULTISPECIES: spore germination protein [Bacillus]